jgi:hypothetical protein
LANWRRHHSCSVGRSRGSSSGPASVTVSSAANETWPTIRLRKLVVGWPLLCTCPSPNRPELSNTCTTSENGVA